MQDFIGGMLESNEDGASYEGEVFDRFLRLRHGSGVELSIFDMEEPISGDLPTGEPYEMILVAALPGPVRHWSEEPWAPASGRWRGTVADACWRVPEGRYQRSRPELYAREWVLLSTPLGHLLMNPDEISAPLAAGDLLAWQDPRLDLYAVI
jgi:hypothetical protein